MNLVLKKNDIFSNFCYSSWLCIMLGLMNAYYFVVCIGIGIAVYGLLFFFDARRFIHQRFKWFRNSNFIY
jgi:beta-carotene 3-hydroxylase